MVRIGSTLLLILFCLVGNAPGQQSSPPPATSNPYPIEPLRRPPRFAMERQILFGIPGDQWALLEGPTRVRPRYLPWVLPLAATAGALVATDVDTTPAFQRRLALRNTKPLADIGIMVAGGTTAGLYVFGIAKHDQKARETALLAASAMGQSAAVGELLKGAFRRERPFVGAQGRFFRDGGDSFPSNHSLLAWSFASVIAREYPAPLVQFGAYGMASAVSLSRVARGKHFPSDVYVGALLGWWIGREVYRRHHDEELGGQSIGTFHRSPDDSAGRERREVASALVALDHWSYAVADRLQSLGVLQSAFISSRPWTRNEFSRLVLEGEDRLAIVDPELQSEGARLLRTLRAEFSPEKEYAGQDCCREAYVESVYTRMGGIAGTPLADGYHFGQTIANDYGRPVREGFNAILGGTVVARSERWLLYVRSEFQHAPEGPPLSLSARQAIAASDFIPLQPATPFAAVNRAHFVEAYLAYQLSGWQMSVGKQSLWWGPSSTAGFLFTNNVESIPMVRVARTEPALLPGFMHWLGPYKTEFFFGVLEGHRFERTSKGLLTAPLARQPMIHGLRVTFKPTPNLEFGVSTTTVFAGPGSPLTLRTLFRSFSFSNADPGAPGDPGDRRAGFDFRYRLPFLRDHVTIYNDAFTEDEISPIAYPRRSAMHPGIYISQLPLLPKVDLRAEGFYTDLPGLRASGQYYFNTRYLSGYTNEGNVIGGPGGRQGLGVKVAGSYWGAPDRRIEAGYSMLDVNKDYIPGGGQQRSIFARVDWKLRPRWALGTYVQYERWNFSVVENGQRSNMSTFVQLTFKPRMRLGR